MSDTCWALRTAVGVWPGGPSPLDPPRKMPDRQGTLVHGRHRSGCRVTSSSWPASRRSVAWGSLGRSEPPDPVPRTPASTPVPGQKTSPHAALDSLARGPSHPSPIRPAISLPSPGGRGAAGGTSLRPRRVRIRSGAAGPQASEPTAPDGAAASTWAGGPLSALTGLGCGRTGGHSPGPGRAAERPYWGRGGRGLQTRPWAWDTLLGPLGRLSV